MRIMIVGTNYSPELTGTGRYTGEMGAWLAARGHAVTVIASPPHYPAWQISEGYRGRWFHTETIAGVTVHRTPTYVPAPHKANGPRRIIMESSFTLASSFWWSRYFLRTRAPDVIIAVCPPTQTIFWPWIMKMLRGTPVLFHVQDLQLDAAARLDMIGGGPFLSLLAYLEKRALQAASHVSTISAKMREKVIAKGLNPERVSILPNWSSISAEADQTKIHAARQRLGARDGQLLALYSGNLGRKQGLDVLLEAIRILKDRSDIHFAIVGGGADEGRLRAIARQLGLPDSLFHPLAAESELPSMLAAADIHLVVQRQEAADLVMPSKLTNILAAGRPSIATATEGTELGDVIAKHGTGLLVAPGDAVALAEAVEWIKENRSHLALMGSNAKAFSQVHNNKTVILESAERILRQLCVN